MELVYDFLIRQGEEVVLELLELSTEDLISRFQDKLEDKLPYIERQMEEE